LGPSCRIHNSRRHKSGDNSTTAAFHPLPPLLSHTPKPRPTLLGRTGLQQKLRLTSGRLRLRPTALRLGRRCGENPASAPNAPLQCRIFDAIAVVTSANALCANRACDMRIVSVLGPDPKLTKWTTAPRILRESCQFKAVSRSPGGVEAAFCPIVHARAARWRHVVRCIPSPADMCDTVCGDIRIRLC